MAELDLSGGWRISTPASGGPAAVAAAELDRCLRLISGAGGGGGAQGGGQHALAIVLAHGEGPGQGFRWRVDAQRVELWGEGPLGLLYASYSMLEALGCRWAWPGAGGERLASGRRLPLSRAAVEERPLLPGRCLVLGHEAFVSEAEQWIVWAARNRLNTVFVHVATGPKPVGAAPEALWRERRGRAAAVARDRGMTIEWGGHLLPELLPGRVLRKLPAALAQGGEADSAVAALRRVVEEEVRAHPEVAVFHLWGEDAPPGALRAAQGGPSPSERALLVANACSEVLEQVRPTAQLAFLAYRDTQPAPSAVHPRANVCLLWAPRERCYAHGIGDSRCRPNARYRDAFRAQLEHFRAAGAPPARVFEYYLDGILFERGVPLLGRVIQSDVAFYAGEGAHTVQALMTGFAGWAEPHPNPWLFARLAWDPRQDPDLLLGQFCDATWRGDEGRRRAARWRATEREVAGGAGH